MNDSLYLLAEGVCRMTLANTKSTLSQMEVKDDPTRKKRNLELQKLSNPHKSKETNQDKMNKLKKRGLVPIED